ncbi:MAG: Cys-tRNA(Pro) deacylase [Mogibacterium sp.]|nr:Cys-tRNA(Pro) deacylase [Mogibacterium sp.]
MNKTNAMRILDQSGLDYSWDEYEYDESDLSGTHAAEVLGVSEDEIFKTLVTRSETKELNVFVIPVAGELDLKKAAQASGHKRIEMIHVRELVDLTGYMRGGCSPIGMKKQYPTYIDETAVLFDRIFFSAGKRGVQIIMNAEDLAGLIGAEFADLTKSS